MTGHQPDTDEFAAVEADPDAVLAAFGAESPDDLLTGPGEHDPTTDDGIDADDDVAEGLFADLSTVSLDGSAVADGPDERPGDEEPDGQSEAVSAHLTPPTIAVAADPDDPLESIVEPDGDRPAVDDRGRSSKPAALTLIGPDPSPVRVADDAFRSGRGARTVDEASIGGGPAVERVPGGSAVERIPGGPG